MEAIERWWRRIHARRARRRLDDELRQEMHSHLAARTQALTGDGMDAAEAAREAPRQSGNVTAASVSRRAPLLS
jgi:hypothetical protein